MSGNEYIHIDDWKLIDVSPSGALKVENAEKPFLESYEPNPDYQCEWLPPTHAEMRGSYGGTDDELWVKEWLALERGMI